MSISWGTQYPKLKTNLRLAINRLKMMGRKKTEMAMKARTEIAEYISVHKEDRARIKVEHIIREDYLVEAYEILEMYCDLLLARFGLIEQVKALEEGIAEAVISILWAAPRIATDITEFKVINDQLTHKYGKPLAEAARGNQLEFPAKVNARLLAKLSVAAPPKILVEKYMILIAEAAGVEFQPDRDIMREDEVTQAEQMLIDFKNAGGAPRPPPNDGPFGGGDSGSGGGGGGYGWQLAGGPQAPSYPPQIPSVPLPYGDDGFYSPSYGDATQGGNPPPLYAQHNPTPNIAQLPPPPAGTDADSSFYDELDGYANLKGGSAHLYDQVPRDYDNNGGYEVPNTTPVLPKIGPNGLPIGQEANYPYLSQRNSMIDDPKKAHNAHNPTAPPQSLKKPENLDSEIHFPEPPSSFTSGPATNNEMDFDELARRFDELKKKP